MSETYHVWFSTRRRKWLLQGEVEERALALIRKIAVDNTIELLASETMIDHVHLLLRLTPDQNLSSCMHRLKGASARRLFQEMPGLKLDIGMEHFWQKRFGSKLVAPQAVDSVRRYIETQKDRPEKYA